MQQNPLLGVVFHWLGGLSSGTFYVPFKGVRKWSWETFWLAGGLFSWLICPWIGGLVMAIGGLIVMWPQAERRRAPSGYVATLTPAHELAGTP